MERWNESSINNYGDKIIIKIKKKIIINTMLIW